MAALLLLPSLILSNRKSRECLCMHSDHLQKGIMYISAYPQNHEYNIKLYMVPCRNITYQHALKCFTTKGSVFLNGARQQNHSFSVVLTSNNLQRSKTMLYSSSNPVDDMNDFGRQLQELFVEVKYMLKMGREDDAKDLLQANYDVVKKQMDAGAKGLEEAAMLDVIALGYMAIGDFEFVECLLKQLNDVVDGLKDDEPLLDSILMHMGSMYSTLGKFEDAMLMYRRSLQILENVFGKNSPFLITPLLGMAKVLVSIGRAAKAEEIYNRAITILELSRGTESEDVVVPLFGLGNLLIQEGKAADAENSFNRILSIYTNLYGENDGRVGVAMCSLAHVMCAKGNVDEAVHLYRKALKVIKDSKYMALDDSVMEKMRIDLAELLHVVGRELEGRELLEECLLISEKYKGNEHPSSVTHLINLATSYSRSKNFVEAERLLRTCLRIIMKAMGPDDQSITFPMLNLAVTLYHLKQDEEAEKLALEALRIREEAFGKESLPVGEALDCLVCIQTKLGKDDAEVLEMLKRVLSIQENELGYENEEVLTTLKKVVFYLDKMGRKDEKFPLQRRLSMLRKKHKERVQC